MAAKETVIGKFVNQILFKVDKSSVDDAKSAISEVKGFAAKALGAIGIGLQRNLAVSTIPSAGQPARWETKRISSRRF